MNFFGCFLNGTTSSEIFSAHAEGHGVSVDCTILYLALQTWCKSKVVASFVMSLTVRLNAMTYKNASRSIFHSCGHVEEYGTWEKLVLFGVSWGELRGGASDVAAQLNRVQEAKKLVEKYIF
jgi:hypothetical protein